MFLYEIFPKHLRTPLHLSAFYLAATFVASAIETGLWCHPISDIWTPSTTRHLSTGGYCTLKISSAYNAIQFSMHMSSMLILILLPVMLLFRAPSRLRGELGFALSILGFGIVSVIASVVAFAMLLRMGNNQTSPTARHMTVLSSVIDQNAIFCGVCLNVVRVWRRGMDMAAVEDHGLVIKVEQRWSVHVDIVERWGYGWKDPWEQGGDSGGLDTQVDPSERLGSAE